MNMTRNHTKISSHITFDVCAHFVKIEKSYTLAIIIIITFI